MAAEATAFLEELPCQVLRICLGYDGGHGHHSGIKFFVLAAAPGICQAWSSQAVGFMLEYTQGQAPDSGLRHGVVRFQFPFGALTLTCF